MYVTGADSWGKLGSGLLSGHSHFHGQYDQCMNVTGTYVDNDHKQEQITTNYCDVTFSLVSAVSIKH